MTRHTLDEYIKTPWAVQGVTRPYIVNAAGKTVVPHGGCHYDAICQAMNTHAELLAACKGILALADGKPPPDFQGTVALVDQVRAAIEKAEGCDA